MDEEKDLKQLEEELKELKARYESAKLIFSSAEEFKRKNEELTSVLEGLNAKAVEQAQEVNSSVESVISLKEKVQNDTNGISVNLNKIKENIESMETSFIKFSEIKGKITERDGEIEELLANAQSLKIDIETLKEGSQKILEEINENLKNVQEKVLNIQEAYEKFLQIKTKLDDNENGLEPVYNLVQSIQKKSQELYSEIKTFRDESADLLVGIRKNNTEAQIVKQKIDEIFSYTVERKAEIETATGLIIDTGFSDTFEKRKREIDKSLKGVLSWKNIFFYSVLLLAISIGVAFSPLVNLGNAGEGITKISEIELFLRRIFFTSPILFLLGFSANQYSKERDMSEKYAFKAATSAAIRNHIDYLKNVGIDSDAFKKFVVDTFAIIYKEPYDGDEHKAKIKYLEKRISDLLNKKDGVIDAQNILSLSKELKELIPEETTFNKVINTLLSVIGKH
jgi:uncharacterized coiled-coil DUF342 family protein